MSAAPLPRVYFDTNEGSHEGGYWLILGRSKEDLHALGDRLCEGEEVLIYMPGELEMVATLHFKKTDDGWGSHWVADPVEGTIKHFY